MSNTCEYNKKYHQENRDRINAKKRQQYQDNPEIKKQWYAENAQRLKINRLKNTLK